MITDAQIIDRAVPFINARIDLIPDALPSWISGEAAEALVLRSGLSIIVPHIPDSVRPYIYSAANGLSPEEVERFTEVTLQSVLSQFPVFIQVAVSSRLRPYIEWVFEFAQEGLGLGSDTPASVATANVKQGDERGA